MTDTKQDMHAELMTLAEKWLAYARMNPANNEHGLKLRAALDAYTRALTDRIAELEAQLEAVGAGGVGAMLPRHARPAPAVVGPVASSAMIARLRENHVTWRDTIDRCAEAADLLEVMAQQPQQPPQIAEPESEPMLRFCPSCGSCGPVPAKFRDCCPDGSDSRVIPAASANKCRNLFQLAIAKAITKEPS